MKIRLLPLLAASVFFVMACQPAPVSPDVQVTRHEINANEDKTVAALNIQGMTCEAGCGGKIQKELRALDGVKETRLNFTEGREVNTVEVDYDPARVNEKQLADKVHSIMDGMYAVKSIDVTTYHAVNNSSATGSGAEMSVYDLSPIVRVIDMLRMVSRLVD
jgi:copper chaperone CopZ